MARIILSPSDIPPEILQQAKEVDLTNTLQPNSKGERREVRSISLEMNGELFWKAKHHEKGVYWTNNNKDPKIGNLVTGKNRGSMQFINGDVGRQGGGRPKGSSNRVSAKDICIMHNADPAEFLVGIMKKEPSLCRKYGIKDLKSISPKLQYDSAKELYNRLEGAAKARQLDGNGDDVLEKEVVNKEDEFVVILEAPDKQDVIEEGVWALEADSRRDIL